MPSSSSRVSSRAVSKGACFASSCRASFMSSLWLLGGALKVKLWISASLPENGSDLGLNICMLQRFYRQFWTGIPQCHYTTKRAKKSASLSHADGYREPTETVQLDQPHEVFSRQVT